MYAALRAKFTQHAGPRAMLLSLGGAELVESSPHDTFWGQVGGAAARSRDGGDGRAAAGRGDGQLGRPKSGRLGYFNPSPVPPCPTQPHHTQPTVPCQPMPCPAPAACTQGFDGSGQNQLGRQLMRLRDELLGAAAGAGGASGTEAASGKAM
jgi:hypothetical protein